MSDSGGLSGALRLTAIWIALAAMLWLAEPSRAWAWLGLAILTIGEAIRCWAAGHLAKNSELVTAGPYAFVRNPLYLGRLLIFTGLTVMAFAPRNTAWVLLAVGHATFFAGYMRRKERVEPERLERLFGERYARYREEVRSLIPRTSRYPGAEAARWSRKRFSRNREHWMVGGLALAAVYLLWRAG